MANIQKVETAISAYVFAVKQILFSDKTKFSAEEGITMEDIVIGNATYLINRVFIGNKNVSELIQKRIEQNICQPLPLTNPVSASYNDSGRNAGLRRNHAN